MKKVISSYPVILFLCLILLLSSCEPGNDMYDAAPADFWMGLWHGFISLFTLVISFFNDHVTVYEIHNTGKFYNLGFVIGIFIFYGGGTNSGRLRRR